MIRKNKHILSIVLFMTVLVIDQIIKVCVKTGMYLGERIEITGDAPMAVNVDGELIFGKTVTMQLVPGGVNFIVPKDMRFFAEGEPVRA